MHIIEVLRKQPKPFKFLLSRLLCILHLNELFTISRPFYKLKFFNTSISKNLWIDNKGRMEDENFLKDYLRRGDFMIDVGANIGTLTLTASSILAENKLQPSIVAIEANPIIYKCLIKNIALNHWQSVVSPLNVAIGNKEQLVTLSGDKNDGLRRVITEDKKSALKMMPLEKISLPPVINLLKIDVEGFELQVLNGAISVLPRIDSIYLEYNRRHTEKYGYSFHEIFDLLKQHGFLFFEPNIKQSTLTPIGENFDATRTINVLAIRPQVLDDRLQSYRRLN